MDDEFAREVVRLLPRLRRFAATLTGKPDEADDLVQSVCERAFKFHASWERGTRLDAWLFRIARNYWIDQIRKRKAAGPETPIDKREDLMGVDGNEVAEHRITLQQVQEAMSSLSPDQRDVLQAVCIDGLSYSEASATLGAPIGTVMSRLSRARSALWKILETGTVEESSVEEEHGR